MKREDLENQLAEANLDLVSLRDEIEGYKKEITAFSQVKMDYETRIKEMEASYQNEIESLKNLLKATETSLNRRVTEALASIGVTNFASEEVISVPQSGKELYEQFLKLSGPAQTEFYRKHEKALSAFMHSKK